MTQRLDSSFTIRPSFLPPPPDTTSSNGYPYYHLPYAQYSASSWSGYHQYPSNNYNGASAGAGAAVHSVVVQFRDHCHRRRHRPNAHHHEDSSDVDDDYSSNLRRHSHPPAAQSPQLQRRLFHDPLPIVSSASPALRAAPFEPFVHERNLPRSRTISTRTTFGTSSYSLRPPPQPHPLVHRVTSSSMNHRYPSNRATSRSPLLAQEEEENSEDRRCTATQRAAFEPPSPPLAATTLEESENNHWKRQCFHLQATLNDTSRSMCALRHEHRQLQRRFERLEHELYLLNSTNNNRTHRQDDEDEVQAESSPVSDLSGASHAASDTESILLASAAKAVTQLEDDDDQGEKEDAPDNAMDEPVTTRRKRRRRHVQLPPKLVLVPHRSIRSSSSPRSLFIGVVADTEDLSEDEDDDGDIFSYYAESSVSAATIRDKENDEPSYQEEEELDDDGRAAITCS